MMNEKFQRIWKCFVCLNLEGGFWIVPAATLWRPSEGTGFHEES